MPVTVSARKKMRQDQKRRSTNRKVLSGLTKSLSLARKKPTSANINLASSLIDQAAKKNIIHQNKAARLKSRLAKRPLVQESEKLIKKSRAKS